MTGLGHFIHDTWDDGSDAVVIPNTQFSNDHATQVTYSGVKFGADGGIYKRQQGGGWSKYGEWLVRGAPGSFWVTRVITSGVLDTDAGAGPLVMSSDRIYDVIALSPFDGNREASVNFEISSDVSGTPVVAGPELLSFSAAILDI